MTITNEERLLPFLKYLKEQKDNENFVIDKTGVKTVEVLDAHLFYNPHQPYLNFPGRKTCERYVKAELDWYNSFDLCVDVIGEEA